jgi:apolipoprotein N-acyltransferase
VSRWLESVLFSPRDEKKIRTEQKFIPLFYTAVAALVLGSVLLYGQMKPGMGSSGDKLRVALVQPNIYLQDNMTFEDRSRHLQVYGEFTRKAAGKDPDLIVWPASSLPDSLASRLVKVQIRKLLEDLNIPLLVGGSGAGKMLSRDEDEKQYANSEFLLSTGGRSNTRYHKQRLVPFNEYLPLEGMIKWPPWITTLEKGYKPGTVFTLFQVANAKFGAPICWESLFPDLFRRFVREGANFMVSVSNEAYMGDTAGPHQSFAMNVFRAVENRVAIVRPAPTGISAIIAPDGRILDMVQDDEGKKLFVSGILIRDIPLSKGRTYYTKHGDVFAFASIAVSIVAVLAMTAASILERSRSEP